MGTLRLLLAVSVVLSHTGGFFKYTMAGGSTAVQVFFAISGFLMQLVLTSKYDPADQKALFYSNRFLRIYPTYAVVVLASALVSLPLANIGAGYFAFLSSRFEHLGAGDLLLIATTTVTLVGQELFLFLRQGTQGLELSGGQIDPLVWPLQIVPQAWSLSLELMFYALVPFLVRLNSRALAAIAVAGFALKLVIVSRGLGFDPWLYRFFPTELPMFILGMLACRMRHLVKDPKPLAYAAIAATLLVQPLTHFGLKVGLPSAAVGALYAALAVCALPALFKASKGSTLDTKLGELSFPVYLVHFQIIVVLHALLPGSGLVYDAVMSLATLAVTLPAAWLLIVLVERPIDALRARRRQSEGKPLARAPRAAVAARAGQ